MRVNKSVRTRIKTSYPGGFHFCFRCPAKYEIPHHLDPAAVIENAF